MSEEMITFQLIRNIQREEQKSPKLARIPDNFYSAAVSYVQQKKQINKEDRKNVLEVKSIERLLEDVFDRRERKIVTAAVNAARTNIQPENMIDEEKDFFDLVTATIRQRRDDSLNKMFKAEQVEKAELIVFNQNISEFVGSDMKNYGPFKKGDIAKLPSENMKIFIDQGTAEKFNMAK